MHICNTDARCIRCIKIGIRSQAHDSIGCFIIVSLSSRNIVRGERALRPNLVAIEVE